MQLFFYPETYQAYDLYQIENWSPEEETNMENTKNGLTSRTRKQYRNNGIPKTKVGGYVPEPLADKVRHRCDLNKITISDMFTALLCTYVEDAENVNICERKKAKNIKISGYVPEHLDSKARNICQEYGYSYSNMLNIMFCDFIARAEQGTLPKKPQIIKFSGYIPEPLEQKLHLVCQQQGHSISTVIETMLTMYVDSLECC